jgi:hypothetical protein
MLTPIASLLIVEMKICKKKNCTQNKSKYLKNKTRKSKSTSFCCCNFSMESLPLAQTNKHTHTKQKFQKDNTRISKLLLLPTIITTYNLFMESSTPPQK